MVTITASRVWALITLKWCWWMSHVPIAWRWPSRSFGPGSNTSKREEFQCLCLDLVLFLETSTVSPLVLSSPPRWHSSRRCMKSLPGHGRHLSLPETGLVTPPPSLLSTAKRPGGKRRSHLWRGRLRCNCVQIPLPPGGANRVSLPGLVSTHPV